MIEKLKTPKSISWGDDVDSCIQRHKIITYTISKINELVDIVNSIVSVQEKLIDSRFVVETKHEEPTDPYVEQRKWIGKLCKFWDVDDGCYIYEILIDIDVSGDLDYPYKTNDASFKYCKPVSEDLIYKG